MFVLDTNVLSELMRGGAQLQAWLAQVRPDEIFCTAITRAEIRYGIDRLPRGRRRSDLSTRAEAVFTEFDDRWLPFDNAAADRFGELVARREAAGSPIGTPDAQIAAITSTHRAVLATRNVKDFLDTGITVVDPFDQRGATSGN